MEKGNINVETQGCQVSEKPFKEIFMNILKKACYVIAIAFIIYRISTHFLGITFDSQTHLGLIDWTGGAAFGGLALFYLKDKVKQVRSRIFLFILTTGVVTILSTIAFPMLHIYDVTSEDNHQEVKYLRSFGKARLGDIRFSSKDGRYFVVNSTNEDIYLLSRLYTIIETSSRDRGKSPTEYTYTGIASDMEPSGSAADNDETIAVIQPHAYYILPLDVLSTTRNIMNTKFGLPSTKHSITTEKRGLTQFYVYYLDKSPIGTNSRNQEKVDHSSSHPIKTGPDVKIEHIYGQ